VDERAAVEQLAIELDAVERRQRLAEQPCPVGVPDDRLRLFGARLLGLAREQRVGGLERPDVDRRRARWQPSEGELRPPQRVLPLAQSERRDQPPTLACGEAAAGPTRPSEPAEPLGIGGAQAVCVGARCTGDRSIIGTPTWIGEIGIDAIEAAALRACATMHAMPARLRPALGLAAGLASVLLSGCGSSGTPTTSAHAGESVSVTGTQSTKAHFVAQAEAACRTLTAQEQPLKARQNSLKGLSAEASDKVFVSIAREVVTFSRSADEKLRALPRPPADAHAIEGLLASFAQEITDTSDIAAAAANQNGTIGEDAEDALKKSIAANSTLAASYGMKDCIGGE
jgi:hypothetical protein